jgi:hypothetical protein
VDGEAKARASLGVSGGKLDTLRLESTASGHSKLVASNVMLRASGRSSSVKRNSLSPQQVVTGRDVGRDLEVELSAYTWSVSYQYRGGVFIQL